MTATGVLDFDTQRLSAGRRAVTPERIPRKKDDFPRRPSADLCFPHPVQRRPYAKFWTKRGGLVLDRSLLVGGMSKRVDK